MLLDLNKTYSNKIYTNTVSTNSSQSDEIIATDEPILASISEVEVKEEPNHEEFIEYPEDEAITRVSPPKKARTSNDYQDGLDTDPGSSSSGSTDSGLFENIYQDYNDNGKYSCNICEKRFSSRSNLQDHKKKNHSLAKTEWKCSLVKCKGNDFSSVSIPSLFIGPDMVPSEILIFSRSWCGGVLRFENLGPYCTRTNEKSRTYSQRAMRGSLPKLKIESFRKMGFKL